MPNDEIRPTEFKVTEQTRDKIELTKVEAGMMGKLFGTGANAPVFIAGFVLIIFSLFGLSITALMIYPGNKGDALKDLWVFIGPVITLALGYIFGGKTTKGD